MNKMNQFLLCVKIKNKLFAVSGTDNKTCQANAQTAFQNAGYCTKTMRTMYSENVMSQKNFAGKSESFKVI